MATRRENISKLRSVITGHIPLEQIVFISEGKGMYSSSRSTELITEDELQLIMARRSLITGTADGNVWIIQRHIFKKK